MGDQNARNTPIHQEVWHLQLLDGYVEIEPTLRARVW